MAGDNNPWRDVFSPTDWTIIKNQAKKPRRQLVIGSRGTAPVNTWTTGVGRPETILNRIGVELGVYDGLPKDDFNQFNARVLKLQEIKRLCDRYVQALGQTHHRSTKTGQKQLTDPIDVWVNSLGKRALKKAAYLQTMDAWHQTAKAKYKSKGAFTTYMMQLAADNTREAGTKLHATPYATIEKFDPYHRQTFVFFDPGKNSVESVNLMGDAMVGYLIGQPANTPDRATNTTASFYEWLEYHPFCVGTPGVTPGYDMQLKQVNRVSYANLDLAHVTMPDGGMTYVRIKSDPIGTAPKPLNTSVFPPSAKGPPGGAAFVWDKDDELWMHEHGYDGFVHASAKEGKKIRCSGMMTVANGLATHVTNESGHYAPNAKTIYYFVDWLANRNCLAPGAQVIIKHAPELNGTYTAANFLNTAKLKYGAGLGRPYHT